MANSIGYHTFRNANRFNSQQNFDRNYERSEMKSYYPENDSSHNDVSDDDSFYKRSQFDNH